ncbi:MAG: hypothetical protein KDA96_20665 [Planctomycetaceae bacterium]|nr:hypothetical protein [Planctomycetaceae bacterium]
MNPKVLLLLFAALSLHVTTCTGGIIAYRNATDWQNNARGSVTTINWDDVAGLADGDFTTISPNRYAGLPGSPLLSVDGTSFLYVGNPDFPSSNDEPFYGRSANPVSESNVFSLNVPGNAVAGPQGILTISFDAPAYSIGAWFLDVEDDFANTGVKVHGQLFAFESTFPEASQEFIGVVSDVPFTEAELYFSANFANGDGVLLDDLLYAVAVPEPPSAAVFAIPLVFFVVRWTIIRIHVT